jgi:UDP-N-acetyl-D-mannosaminuronic acid dehydrogenase
MEYVWNAATMIAPYVEAGALVILESTSPVGSTERVAEILRAHGASVDEVSVAHCPERVLPGRIMIELSENDRIVGGVDDNATRRVAEFYRDFVVGEVLESDARTAEMTKLVENASRDVQIAFANELSMLGDRFGVDVWEVIELANHHPRVNILNPGPGVGGHCIAVDPWFLVDSAPEDAVLIRTARERNLEKTRFVIEQISSLAGSIGERLGRSARVALLGLAYKANIDDLRESPALEVARALAARGLSLVVSEPNLAHHDEFSLQTPERAVADADLVVYLVAHREFIDLDTGDRDVLDLCGATR